MAQFEKAKLRTTRLYIKTFNSNATDFFKSPGRIELVGNHTDHQGGKTCSLTINQYIYAVSGQSASPFINVVNTSYPFVLTIDTSLTHINEENKGTSKALIEGVVAYFNKHGFNVGAFNASLTSDLPRGAGLSSSAAYAVLFGKILNYYYNDNKISDLHIALAAQYAEMVHFGKPCGLLDQVSIAFGGLIFSDFHTNPPHVINYHHALPALKFFVIDTGGKHDNLTSYYEKIREEMACVSKHFGCHLLSEIPAAMFRKSVSNNLIKCSTRALNRAQHFYDENKRVEAFNVAFSEGNSQAMLTLIAKSGESSARLLENLTYEGDNEQALLKHYEFLKINYATKVLGGGFAGALLVATAPSVRREHLIKYYEDHGFRVPRIYVMNEDKDGASFVEKI